MVSKARLYIGLTKPRVLQGNVITGAAGFLLASGIAKHFYPGLFIATIVGMTLVIASACALNNYLDQDIDRLMERTKDRALPAGLLPGYGAVILSVVLGVVGMLVLIVWVNSLVVLIGLGGFIVYVWLYGAFSKRRSIYGTLVGSISGSAPILAGYCAVSGKIDLTAVSLFFMIFFWQFPEFFSIAIYRRSEYKAAKIPVMTVVRGVKATKKQIFIYSIVYVLVTLVPTVLRKTGWIYFAVMLGSGLAFIRYAYRGLGMRASNEWAKQMFHFSLMHLILLSIMLSLGAIIP